MWTALLNREVIDLESMSAPDKITLRSEAPPFKCRGCKGPVHTRHVPDGGDADPFLVFAHNPGAAQLCRELGYHTDESDEHHRLKSTLASSARVAGWAVDFEVPGDRCRADVVATKGGRTRVLEAQISALSVPQAIERTQRYSDCFGDPLWTHTRRRDWAKQVPSIQIDSAEEASPTVVGGVMVDQEGRVLAPPAPLTRVVPSILSGRLRYLHDPREEFGFFLDLRQATAKASPPQLTPPAPRGTYVKDICDRPVAAVVVGAMPSPAERPPCVWCGNPTARVDRQGDARHMWCEERDRGIWVQLRRPDKAEIKEYR